MPLDPGFSSIADPLNMERHAATLSGTFSWQRRSLRRTGILNAALSASIGSSMCAGA